MNISEISSKTNSHIKEYMKICENAKCRRKTGLFVAEGMRLVRDSILNGNMPEKLFCTKNAYEEISMFPMFSNIDQIFIISDAIAEYISQTDNTQGFFAIFKKPDATLAEDIFKDSKNILILDKVRDPGNLGTIIRTCDALEIDAIIFCECCDIFNPKTIRAAMGAVMRMKYCDNMKDIDILEISKKSECVNFAAALVPESKALDGNSFGYEKQAVWIGNEANGLPENIIEKCEKKIIIPISTKAESLNAAIAAGILVWEMREQRRTL